MAEAASGSPAAPPIRAGAQAPGVREALALGLTEHEYQLVCAKQGRAPNALELAMYSLLWSEHCAYKHSRLLLRTLPSEGPAVVLGPGENAGVVELGEGVVCAMKVESHNHPSAVEPFQGAATGVGGILRDIFAMGARPIAVLDSLRFGEAGSPRTRYLLEGVVSGIGHYGNSIGVPTVGGEVYFEAPYAQSCLVGAMALGLAERGQLVRAAAAGPGNAVVLLGARTGRDGIGGASVLASADLDERARERRPSVQVGDPFEESKLLECSLELLRRGLLVALQDLGAAGLTSASAEMAAKGGVGMDIDVAAVPLREPAMEPWEIMVSESQERMLCVIRPGDLPAALETCARFEIAASAIGQVTDSGLIRVLDRGEPVGELPVRALVDECPLYELEPERPAAQLYPAPPPLLRADCSAREALLALLACPNIASRRPLFERYDFIVGSRTVRRPGEADAAVLLIDPGHQPPDGARRALAASIDGNGRRVAADPYQGAVEAVLECAANLACTGAQPLGVTDNLSFGNPARGHVAWQLSEAVRGLGDACRALGTPVVGGNVSLYNDGPAGPIYPTPVVGMVGLVPDARRAGRLGFARAGDAIALAGPFRPALGASELHKLLGEPLPGGLARAELAAVRGAQDAIREGVRDGALASAHDIAEGGLAVAIAECCLAGGLGARVRLPDELLQRVGAQPGASAWRALLFGEAPGGFVVSGAQQGLAALAARTPLVMIGHAGGELLRIDAGGEHVEATLAELARASDSLGALLP